MDKLDLITALVNQANGAGVTAEEREAFLAKADALMFKYKIDAAMVEANAAGKDISGSLSTPTHELIDWVPTWDEFRDIHTLVVAALANLTGVQPVLKVRQLHLFGYAPDIRYFRELWTGCFLTFSSKLSPKWDRALSDEENIAILIESGQKWLEVWKEGTLAGGLAEVKMPPADNGKMKRLYAKDCKRRGVEKMKLTFNRQDYRNSFALGYRDVIVERCERLRWQRLQMEREASSGVGIVLRSQATAVQDLMNKMYPDLNYTDTSSLERRRGNHSAGRNLGAAAGRSIDLAQSGKVGGRAGAAGAIE